ncbi:hypothetical protein [Streptomyces sp. NPDC006610]|uniref:hypothetical protein n=1 Tax=Streptomyces sp. NPDC006610 TaxID=3154584 RepID=UPI0033A4EFE0
MQNYTFTWTDPDGRPRASAVAYDQHSADERKTELEAAGCTAVEIVPVQPGQLLAP